MSIIIKGMKMPRSCSECKIRIALGCCGTLPHNTRVPTCPLIELPPHGRLIDADKQDAQIEALIERHLHGYTKSTWDFVCELRDILKRNSTIIEAEVEEE